MIYLVMARHKWEQAVEAGYYEPDSLAIEGFIHACGQLQVDGVLNRYFQGQTDLVLLHLDENKLMAEVKYEYATSVGENFPHIYGKVNTDAVEKVTPI